MSILIVEDNPISSRVLEHTLDKYGYHTHTAGDGEQALELLDAHPEIQLVITDLVMPKTDGMELVRRIKERPEWRDIPIILCTSKTPASITNRYRMEGGKVEFKPIKTDSLLGKVKASLAQQRPIMQNPDQTMSQIGMDLQGFLDILDEFLKLINDNITRVEQHGKESSEQLLDRDMDNLMEGAKLLRADRVTDILERLSRSPSAKKQESISSLYPLLLRELKALQHALLLMKTARDRVLKNTSLVIYGSHLGARGVKLTLQGDNASATTNAETGAR